MRRLSLDDLVVQGERRLGDGDHGAEIGEQLEWRRPATALLRIAR
ncbi:MAG: hypothetical protein ACR2FE_03505 [Aeromicrobium sp.]